MQKILLTVLITLMATIISQATVIEVGIMNFAFDPTHITINPGDSVRWTNFDAAPHTSTSTTGPSPALRTATGSASEPYAVQVTAMVTVSSPRVTDAGADQEDLSKVEAAVLDLARAGFTVRRIVDFIPEPDSEIYRALASLRDRGTLSF